jgi:hypothetical protein
MKRFGLWLLAPWRGLVEGRLTHQHKAVVAGLAATAGLLYGGWLLLVDKDALRQRNVAAVILAPDYGIRVPARTAVESTISGGCSAYAPIYGSAPSRPGCINWRQPARPPARTILNGLTGKRIPAPTFTPPGGLGLWTGDMRLSSAATSAIYGGNRRSDGFRSIRADLGSTATRLAPLAGVTFAVLVGVSTGFHYLRRNPEDDAIGSPESESDA